jgi:hypothetical protein
MGAARIVDAVVDRSSHVFEEAAEDSGIDFCDLKRRVEVKGGGFHEIGSIL